MTQRNAVPNWFSRFAMNWKKLALWKRLGIILVPILLVAGGILGYSQLYLPSQKTVQPALQTTTVKRGDIVLYASGTGTLITSNQASLGFQTSGTIKGLYVAVGDSVAKGQLLAALDDAKEQVQLAQANRTLRELTSPAAIATTQENLAVAQQTVITSRRDLAYEISPDVLFWEEKLSAAEKALASAQADQSASATGTAATIQNLQKAVDQAKAGLAYVQSQYVQEYVPDTFTVTQMDATTHQRVTSIQAPTDADIAAARATYAQAQWSVLEDQDLLTALEGKEVPADATGSGLTALENAQQNVQAAQAALDATKIYAPINGTVTTLTAAVGDTVGSSAIITIQDLLQPYQLTVYLDESDWSSVKVGYPVEVTFDILPDKVLNGKVTSVNPVLTQSAGASVIQGTVQLDDTTASALPVGTSASVDVIGGSAKNVLLVSVDALHEVSTGQYTVFIVENGKPKVRAVEIGLMDSVNAEVKSGLAEGDVITTGILVTK